MEIFDTLHIKIYMVALNLTCQSVNWRNRKYGLKSFDIEYAIHSNKTKLLTSVIDIVNIIFIWADIHDKYEVSNFQP